MATESIEIIPMQAGHLDKINVIEQQVFTSEAWPMETYLYELKENQFAHYFSLLKDGLVIGYIGLWIVIDDAQITTFCIDRAYQGQGYGDKLISHCIHYASMRCIRISLEVRESNHSAIRLYRKHGFVDGGVRKAYYGDGENALVMWRYLS